MLRSELLEREAEARRIELAETFDELRARATPGHVVDQLVDFASASGGVDFFRNLRDQTVANPLALGLVGAGLAWLIMSNGRERRAYSPYDVYESYDEMRPPRGRLRGYFAGARERAGSAMSGAQHLVSDTAAGVRDRVSDAAHMAAGAAGSVASTAASTARGARDAAFGTMSSVGETVSAVGDTVSSVGGQAGSRAGDAAASLGNAASALYGGVSHTAGRTASGMRSFASGTAATGRDAFDFARDQPLVLAGLGLAFGAVMGAAFRSTDTERQLMGEASDDLRERTQAFAAQNIEKSKSMAEAVYDEFQNRIREGSSSSDKESSRQSSAGHTGIIPIEDEIEDIQERVQNPTRPERILRDDRS